MSLPLAFDKAAHRILLTDHACVCHEIGSQSRRDAHMNMIMSNPIDTIKDAVK